MDFTRALTYSFDDPDWVTKLGIAAGIALLFFIPIIGSIPAWILLAGWSLEIAKRVRASDSNPLPRWDFGTIFSRGLNPFIAFIIYELPIVILACVAAGIFAVAASGGGNNEDLSNALGGFGSLVCLCCGCLAFLYAIAAAIVYWGGYIRYLDSEQLGTFFQFGDNFALVQNNVGDFGQAALFLIAGGFVISLVGSVIPILGTAAAIALQQAYGGHILGQLASKLRSGSTMTPAV